MNLCLKGDNSKSHQSAQIYQVSDVAEEGVEEGTDVRGDIILGEGHERVAVDGYLTERVSGYTDCDRVLERLAATR